MTLIFWLHMLATVTWVGSLVVLSMIVLPSMRVLKGEQAAGFLSGTRKKMNTLGIFSLLILAGTGMFQMSASPEYQGFLKFNNLWGMALLIKHLAFLLVVGLSAYLSWILFPQYEQVVLRLRNRKSNTQLVSAELESACNGLQTREKLLLNLNIILAVIILGLTAVARVS